MNFVSTSCLLMIISLNFLPNICYCETRFSFAGILWTDSFQDVAEKVKNIEDMRGFLDKAPSNPADNISAAVHPLIISKDNDLKELFSYISKTGRDSILYSKVHNKHVELPKDTLCKTGDIYFSKLTKQLMFYKFEIPYKYGDMIIDKYSKKYGKEDYKDVAESKIREVPPASWYVWKRDDEIFIIQHGFVFDTTTLVYINKNNIKIAVDSFMNNKSDEFGGDGRRLDKLF